MFRTLSTQAHSTRLFPIVLCILVLLITVGPALAVDIPPTGANAYLQTTGAGANLNIGDFYTNAAGGNDPNGHSTEILVPCTWPTATSITFALFDPEVNLTTANDEVRGAANNSAFTLTAPGGNVTTRTFTPLGGSNGLWVELITLSPETATFGCGTYILRNTTAGNDDNDWQLRVSHDPDCDNTPGACSTLGAATSALMNNGNEANDADGVAGTGDELVIGLVQIALQHTAASCQDFFEFVSGTVSPITFNNFDMDGVTSVTYFPPASSSLAPSQPGTVSPDSQWNNSAAGAPPPRGGDSFVVGADDAGWWRAQVCVTAPNQYVYEGQQSEPMYFTQPGTPQMVVTKSDGTSSVSPGATITYTIAFSNTSNATSTPGAATNVTLVDTLPSNTAFVGAAILPPFTGTVTPGAGTVTFALNQPVAAGSAGRLQVIVTVNSPLPPGVTTLTNTVSLSYQDPLGNAFPQVSASDVNTVAPTAVELLYFRVEDVSGRRVTLGWATAAEIDNFGFTVYRARSSSFRWAVPIHFEPASIERRGAVYAFADVVPTRGEWWYWLADVDTNGLETIHAPIRAVVDRSAPLPARSGTP